MEVFTERKGACSVVPNRGIRRAEEPKHRDTHDQRPLGGGRREALITRSLQAGYVAIIALRHTRLGEPFDYAAIPKRLTVGETMPAVELNEGYKALQRSFFITTCGAALIARTPSATLVPYSRWVRRGKPSQRLTPLPLYDVNFYNRHYR